MINYNVLGLVFLVLSLILFIYGIRNYKSAAMVYIYAIGLNVIPLLPFGYIGNEETRFGRIPIAYIPIIFAILASIIKSKFKILKRDMRLFYIFIVLITYLLLQSLFIIKHYVSFVQYYLMWVLNIYAMFSVSYIFSKIHYSCFLKMLKKYAILIGIFCLIGVIKFSIGSISDANFMPLMNRNGTVFLVVAFSPFLLMLKNLKYFNNIIFYVVFLIYSLNIILMQSRMGFFGFIFVIILHFFYKMNSANIKNKMKYYFNSFAILIILLLMVFVSPIGDYIKPRIMRTEATLHKIIFQENFTSDMRDYTRFQLVSYGIEIFKNNILFGTGVGLENYREKLREIIVDPIKESKPHNFYISYAAEFGLIGFSLVILLLYYVWKGIDIRNINFAHKEIMIAFKIMFLSTIFMLLMNEYITYPIVWVLWGMGIGTLNNHPYLLTRSSFEY